jgi:hypothetical protein
MAKYSDIKGFTVQTLSTDTVASQVEGGSWASGGAANTGREGPGSNGTQTSNLVYGGSPPATNKTESYNGTAFTEVADLNTTRYSLGGAGVSNTSAVGFGGYAPGGASDVTETWNGSSWTEVNDLNTARYGIAGAGIITSAIGIAGYTTTIVTNVETWDGSSWTEVAEFNTSRYVVGSTGHDNEAVIIFGGAAPSKVDNVEIWNGSSWTEVAEINSARNSPSGSGTDSLALAYGGRTPSPGATTKTESWNGTSWTEVNDLSTGRANGGGSNYGTSSAALFSLGNREPGLSPAPTEEFTAPSTFNQITQGQLFFNSTTNTFKETIRDIPAGTWATSGSLNSAHAYGTGFGLQTAAVSCFGAVGPSPVSANKSTNTELYNGTSWTEVNEGNTARSNMGSSGTQTSGLAYGGGNAPPIRQQTTESWNGTSWTSAPNLPTGVYNNRGLGTSSTSAISIGGVDDATPGKSKKAAEYDGTSWTSISDMGTIRESGGTSNAAPTSLALAFGGESPSLTVNNEEWNGSSWTEKSNMNTAKGDFGFNGISTSALAFAGSTPASPPYQQAICEFWNGTTWTELADLGTGIANGIAPAGGAVFGLASGGLTSPTAANTGTEEWTAALANKTITAS